MTQSNFKILEGFLDSIEVVDNLGLLFNKAIPLISYIEDGRNIKPIKSLIENKDIKRKNHLLKALIDKYAREKALECKANIIKDYKNCSYIEIRTKSRLALGLGLPSFFENGITLHHIYGIPYIPASTFKGLLRFTFLSVVLDIIPNEDEILEDIKLTFSNNGPLEPLEQNPYTLIVPFEEKLINSKNVEEFLKITDTEFKITIPYKGYKGKNKKIYTLKFKELFGNSEETINKLKVIYHLYEFLFGTLYHRGGVIYFDAYPEDFKLEVDIMNPHYGEYYKELPKLAGDEKLSGDLKNKEKQIYLIGDWHNPKPIFFLTISPGVKFTFCYKFDNYFFEKLVEKFEELKNMDVEITEERIKNLIQALLEIGLEWWGLGAKRRKGYGDVELINGNTE